MVHRETLLSHITFLLYINNLKTVANSMKYVEDSTAVSEAYHRLDSDSHLHEAADQPSTCTETNDMHANSNKTKYMDIYCGTVPLTMQSIVINVSEIDHVLVF